MARTPKKEKGTPKKKKGENQSEIRIRMHTVGFGDCFLLFLPTSAGIKKVLIDCGSLKKKSLSISEVADAVRTASTDADGVARIDIVVMSHRHADHISGFVPGRWDGVEVKEVWMPWLESRADNTARTLRKASDRRIRQLIATFQAAGVSEDLLQVLLNARSNEDSLDVLHEGFAGKARRRFLPEKETAVEAVECDHLPGIKTFVLGPPRDEKALKSDDPPTGESFLREYVNDSAAGGSTKRFQPLSVDWVSNDPPALPDRDAIRQSVENLAAYEAAAAAVDAELNNTSLIIIFKVGSEYLLFPGDAQWGPWEKVLQDEDAVALLEKVTFIKVGHHASHNASPVSVIRKHLGKKNVHGGAVKAMISVTPYAQWKGVPYKPLLEELNATRFTTANSDLLQDQPGFTRKDDIWIEAKL